MKEEREVAFSLLLVVMVPLFIILSVFSSLSHSKTERGW